MSHAVPSHVEGLLAYLRQPNERANEDLAIGYFRTVFGETFTRQREAQQSDGYVAGSFVLELKGQSSAWLSGLFQGLAYKNRDLDFAQIVVASKGFLAIWNVDDIPLVIREEVWSEKGAPNTIGVSTESMHGAQLIPERTKFERVLCKRLALASTLVSELHGDPNFGRTKLAKLFYLADLCEGMDLDTHYVREAAGPLDQRALYNERIGIEALGQKYDLFSHSVRGKMVRYEPGPSLNTAREFIERHLGKKLPKIRKLASMFKELDTDQSEIVATLFACWNDLLLSKSKPTDEEIVTEFLLHWHPKKSRFARTRLVKALIWMKNNGIVPNGTGRLTGTKVVTDIPALN